MRVETSQQPPPGGGFRVEASTAEVSLPPHGATIGPVLISGRQHCGNTVMAAMFKRVPYCYAHLDEGAFFEHRPIIDKVSDPAERARYAHRQIRVEEPGLVEPCLAHLVDWAASHPSAGAVDLYREGMRYLTEASGKRFWIQKATSYIFYGDEIMRTMPEARLIYMLRNPYDLATSEKRRGKVRKRNWEYVWGRTLSWNKGLRIAMRLEREHPHRFFIMQYERMVSEPNVVVRELFERLGIPFHPSYLDVYHMNKSEHGYSLDSQQAQTGLSASRVYYYVNDMSAAEIRAIDWLVAPEAWTRWYPDLPHAAARGSPLGLGARLRAMWLVAKGPIHFAFDYIRLIRRSPRHLIARSLQRLRRA